MQPAELKLERFANPRFPLYLSVQSGQRTLVKIHYHTSAELIQVIAGEVELLSCGIRQDCHAGDIVFIPPSAVHEMTGLTPAASIRGVIYEPSLTVFSALPMEFDALLAANRQGQYLVPSSAEEARELNGCIEQLHACYPAQSMADMRQAIACLLQAEAVLIRLFGLEESAQNSQYRKLQPAFAYMREHYAQKIRISDLSSLLHVCDDRLIRLFREVTGDTPVAWLNSLRVEACLRLLAGTDDSLADIAEKTGFGSAAYMTRVFRQKLNATPGQYRRR